MLESTNISRTMSIIGMWLMVTRLLSAEALSTMPDWLEIEAQFEIEVTREQNFDLELPQSDARHILRPEFQLETRLQPWPAIEGSLLLELAHAFDVQDDTNSDALPHAEFSVKEAFITVDVQSLLGIPISLQIGRQTFEDDRQWLYDDELDAIRIVFHLSRFRLVAAWARFALFDEDLANRQGADDTTFYHLDAQYRFGPFLTLAAYGLGLDDHQPQGERPVFVGLRVRGGWETRVRYWLDVAHVRGKSEGQRLRGWGLDIGFLYVLNVAVEPMFMLGYAFGSGDDTPDDSTHTHFRQTGLQGNATPYNSITDLHYYGELFDPELSNLHILTVGVGFRPIQDASVTVLVTVHAIKQGLPCGY